MTVTGQSPVVETTKNDVGSVVTQEQIQSLPIANRQSLSLVLLLPGTARRTRRRRIARRRRSAAAAPSNDEQHVFRRWRAEPDLQLRPAVPGGAAVGDSGIQGQSQPGVGPVRCGRRRGPHRDQERHQPVQRRGVRVFPRQEPQHAGQAPGRSGGDHSAKRSRTTGAIRTGCALAVPSSRIACTSSSRSSVPRTRGRRRSIPACRSSIRRSRATFPPRSSSARGSRAATSRSTSSRTCSGRYVHGQWS